MAVTSGSVTTNTISKSYFYVSWSQTSQSTANNETYISWTAGLYTGTSSSHDNFYSNAVKIKNVYINGTLASNGGTWSNIKTGGNHDLLSGTATIPHSSDGTKTFTISIEAWTYSSSNYSGSDSFVLTNIPRQAKLVSAPNFNDEQNPTITYSNPAGTAVSKLQVAISITGTDDIPFRDISKTGTSYTFNLTDAERQTIYNRMTIYNQVNISFDLKTTIGGVDYHDYLYRTLSIVNASPSITTKTYEDTNQTTLAITSNNQVLIQNKSTLQYNFATLTAKKKAYPTELSININGTITTYDLTHDSLYASGVDYYIASKTIAYGVVDVSENTTSVVTLKDSRGNTTSYNMALTIWEYYTPTAIIKTYRESNFYTESHIKVDANYASLSSHNTILIKYRTKKSTEQGWGNWTTISDNVEADFNADNQYAWDVEVYLEDILGTTYTYTINKALDVGIPIVFYDVLKRSVGVNCLPSHNESLEVSNAIILDGTSVKDLIISRDYNKQFTVAGGGITRGSVDVPVIDGYTCIAHVLRSSASNYVMIQTATNGDFVMLNTSSSQLNLTIYGKFIFRKN